MVQQLFSIRFCTFALIFSPTMMQDRDKLMALLTKPLVEEDVKNRVLMKAQTYGQEVKVSEGKDNNSGTVYRIEPTLIAKLYVDWIMPLTKQVQVEYLLRRLD